MNCGRKKILFISDLNYPARARAFYGAEDVYLTGRLRERFDLAICDLPSARGFEDSADLIVMRNSGAVAFIRDEYLDFRRRVREKKLKVFNELCGIGDQVGKQYLIDFTAAGHPVIPSVDRLSDIGRLGEHEIYCIKPKDGADSNGLAFPDKNELMRLSLPDGEYIIQPRIDFVYEVSFYFINDRFEYAMYAPDKTRRWELKPYSPDEEDLRFARTFIGLSPVKNGIQRIDACRTRQGGLLLMELEDLNPYLSLDLLPPEMQDRFPDDLTAALEKLL